MNSRHPTPVDHPDTALPRIEEVRKERDERQLIWESCICVYCICVFTITMLPISIAVTPILTMINFLPPFNNILITYYNHFVKYLTMAA